VWAASDTEKDGTAMTDSTLSLLQDIQRQLSYLRTEVAELSVLLGKRARKLEPGFIHIADAACLIGKTTKGLQSYLERVLADPDCPPVRRIHGAIHRADFERLIAVKSKPRGRGAFVRDALEDR